MRCVANFAHRVPGNQGVLKQLKGSVVEKNVENHWIRRQHGAKDHVGSKT